MTRGDIVELVEIQVWVNLQGSFVRRERFRMKFTGSGFVSTGLPAPEEKRGLTQHRQRVAQERLMRVEFTLVPLVRDASVSGRASIICPADHQEGGCPQAARHNR